MPAVPAQSRSRAVLGPDARAERGTAGAERGECGCGAGRCAAGSGGALRSAGADTGPLWARGWVCAGVTGALGCAELCHLHRARGPSGGRILPWRDFAPPWRAAGSFPPGLPGAGAALAGPAAEPLGGTAVGCRVRPCGHKRGRL